MEKTPFTSEFDESRYFPAAGHEEAIARASYAIEQRHPVAVLSGANGVGKTFLLKMLATRIRSSGRVSVLVETPVDDDDVRSRLAEQIGLPTWQNGARQPTWNQIREALRGLQLTERQTVLLIELAPEETLLPSLSRLLAWSRGEFRGALTVLIAGSPKLATIHQTADRFAMLRIELAPWSVTETSQFIRYQIARFGSQSLRFRDSAMRTVADLAKGIPRDVLAICDLAWNAARVDGLAEIDEDVVLAAVREWTTRPGFFCSTPIIPEPSRASIQRAAAEEFAIH